MSSSETNKPYRCEECGISFKSQQELQEHNNQEHIGTAWNYRESLSCMHRQEEKFFNAFHFGFAADPTTLKIDQAISDSFSAYCQIAVHMLCSFSHNF